MLLALHSLLFQESSSVDANVSINGNDVVSFGGNSVATGTSLINTLGNNIVSDSNNITLSASANVIENGTAIGFYQGNVSVQINRFVLVSGELSSLNGGIVGVLANAISQANGSTLSIGFGNVEVTTNLSATIEVLGTGLYLLNGNVSVFTNSNINITSNSINILINGKIVKSYHNDVLAFAQYKISAYSKIEIENKFNKIENNLTFDIINKETIKLTLENK